MQWRSLNNMGKKYKVRTHWDSKILVINSMGKIQSMNPLDSKMMENFINILGNK